MKILFVQGNGGGGRWGCWEKVRPQSQNILGLMDFPRTLRSPILGPPRGPVGTLRPRQDSGVLSAWDKAGPRSPHCPTKYCTGTPTQRPPQGSAPSQEPWDQEIMWNTNCGPKEIKPLLGARRGSKSSFWNSKNFYKKKFQGEQTEITKWKQRKPLNEQLKDKRKTPKSQGNKVSWMKQQIKESD